MVRAPYWFWIKRDKLLQPYPIFIKIDWFYFTVKLFWYDPQFEVLTPFFTEPVYDDSPAITSTFALPPEALSIAPEWTAALHIEESVVYLSVPQTLPPFVPQSAGQTAIKLFCSSKFWDLIESPHERLTFLPQAPANTAIEITIPVIINFLFFIFIPSSI